MIFSSPEFIFLFLPVVILLVHLLKGSKNVITCLIIMSLIYYGYWDYRYLSLIVLSCLFNFKLARIIQNRNSYPLLSLGVTANLILLGYFKYFNFFIDTVNDLFSANIANKNIVLPLAISFFTFQQIAFLVDSYQGKCEEKKFSFYLLFISFFPQLIAGPIVHHKDLIPQFKNYNDINVKAKNLYWGLCRFAIGLFKKVVIADSLSPFVSQVFDTGLDNSILNLLGVLAYTSQLYFDFSGYSDMAIGIAKMLGIKLPENFNSPYQAINISDFWRRWHITLSSFLRDYLYIPLGGNRKGQGRRYFNLFMTMFLGGIWHGAGWNYVLWGTLHGFFLIIHQLSSKVFKLNSVLLSKSITFLSVILAWVFFRSGTITNGIEIIKKIFAYNISSWQHLDYSVVSFTIISILLSFMAPNAQGLLETLKDSKRSKSIDLFLFILLSISLIKILYSGQAQEFLYYEF